MRNLKSYLGITLRGLAMGAADVVPGVSGGTIAFITGIYEELIDTINRIDADALKLLLKGDIKGVWNHINANFLLSLFVGIGISIVSLAKLITYLLSAHPILIWSFFFGLVFASIFFVGKQVTKWNAASITSFGIGAVVAYAITILPASESSGELWYIFVSGMIAICAMILPGISGSFILLLMGSYESILNAIHERDFVTIGVFGAGAVIGLLSFARVLKWMFAKYHNITVALLTGFLLGSLNKIWPWKETLEVFVKHPGTPKEKIIPLVEQNIMPGTYESVAGEPSQVVLAIVFALVGFVLIFGMEKMAELGQKKS